MSRRPASGCTNVEPSRPRSGPTRTGTAGTGTRVMVTAPPRRCSPRNVLSMSNDSGRPDFDELYRDTRLADGAPPSTPWDIGSPQPVVEQLVAYDALHGRVLDPGTGPGHHAIYFASKGYSVTGI